jgi:hypothetical protein
MSIPFSLAGEKCVPKRKIGVFIYAEAVQSIKKYYERRKQRVGKQFFYTINENSNSR